MSSRDGRVPPVRRARLPVRPPSSSGGEQRGGRGGSDLDELPFRLGGDLHFTAWLRAEQLPIDTSSGTTKRTVASPVSLPPIDSGVPAAMMTPFAMTAS